MIRHEFLLVVFAGIAWCSTFSANVVAAEDEPQIVCLHTEFLPYKHTIKKQISYRLMRELVRQSFVIAAQEELGVVVRDGSLYESVPDKNVKHLAVLERASMNRRWQVKLFEIDDPSIKSPAKGLWKDSPVWEETYKFTPGPSMYAPMTSKFEKAVRNEFADALTAAGVKRQTRIADSGDQPDAEQLQEWDKRLLIVDAATQFGVLRDIHRSMRRSGESVAHLERLCRGYANLSLLTQHHWNSTYEVFGARSLIYGRRLLNKSDDDDRIRIHQSYAFALVGAHRSGIARIQSVRQRNLLDNPSESDQWVRLIEPYLDCDRAAVKQIGVDSEALKPWAQFLWFQQTAAYRIPQWLKSAGTEVLQDAPAAYGVYEMMARCGGYLRVQRFGAHMALPALGQNVRNSLASVIDIPKSVLVELGLQGNLRQGVLPRDGIFNAVSPVSRFAASRLRKEAENDFESNLSWSALATLLEDEQFGMIANLLVDSANAVESSQAESAKKLLPLVEGHRYSAVIEAFQYDRFREFGEIIDTIGNMELHDPRYNMGLLLRYHARVQEAKGVPSSKRAKASRNFTMQGLLERTRHANETPSSMVANEFVRASPNHEVGVRWQIMTDKKPTVEKLEQWEQDLEEDPISFRLLGDRFETLKDSKNAVRCYQVSMSLLPSFETARELAAHYQSTDQLEKWEQVLLDYLETEDLGLEHAGAQRLLAKGLISQGRWQDAEHHAVLAAKTYQAVSMQVASYVLEGLAEWDESEQWIKALSQSYPSSSGGEWYLWCRRTGRGNLESARELASRQFQVPNWKESFPHVCYLIMEDEIDLATTIYERIHRKTFTDSGAFLLHDLYIEQGETKKAARTLANAKEIVQERHVEWKREKARNDSSEKDSIVPHKAILGLIKLTESSDFDITEIERVAEQIESMNAVPQSFQFYFLGRKLARLGKEDLAIRYWERSLQTIHGNVYYATLSGNELCKRTETSRGNDSSRDEDDL